MVTRMAWNVALGAGAFLIGTVLYWQVDVISKGGPIMIPIVMCSVFALSILIARVWYFASLGPDAGHFLIELRTLVQRQAWAEADTLCQKTPGPVARVTRAGLVARDRSAQEIDGVMEEAAHEELPKIERHHRWLTTIAQVATLLGLLGTVVGMVLCFQVIESKGAGAGGVNPADLAGGIWQALITTVGGLMVAVPTILAHAYLSSRAAELIFQMEHAAAILTRQARR